MKKGKVDKIWFFEKPTGKIHPPLTLSKSELLLPKFKWNVDYRPLNKHEIFIWDKGLGKNISVGDETQNTNKNNKPKTDNKDKNEAKQTIHNKPTSKHIIEDI